MLRKKKVKGWAEPRDAGIGNAGLACCFLLALPCLLPLCLQFVPFTLKRTQTIKSPVSKTKKRGFHRTFYTYPVGCCGGGCSCVKYGC